MNELFERLYCQTLIFKRGTETFTATLCLGSIPLGKLEKYAQAFLHPKELAYLATLSVDRRRLSYLLGCIVTKQAISCYGVKANFNDILLDSGVFGFPLVSYPGNDKVHVTISHCDETAIALAFPEAHPMGIDLEIVNEKRISVIETQLTPEEINLIHKLREPSQAKSYTYFWTIKEALSKVLRTGLMTPFEIFAVKNIQEESNHWLSEFKNFAQYKALSFELEPNIVSIVYPKKSEINIDIPAIQHWFAKIS